MHFEPGNLVSRHLDHCVFDSNRVDQRLALRLHSPEVHGQPAELQRLSL